MREARVLLPGSAASVVATVRDPSTNTVQIGNRTLQQHAFSWAPPLTGLIYGVVLNDRTSVERLTGALDKPPYKAPPRAPVLYIKPYNTHMGHQGRVRLPTGEEQVEVAATLGVVMGADASRVTPERALDYVCGYTVVADLSLPHSSYFRPAIREKCFDGACPIGPWVLPREALSAPETAQISTYSQGQLLEHHTLENLVRPIPQLVADVTEFMTLKAGDVLLCGVRYGAPVVTADSDVEVEIEGLGRLSFRVERSERAEDAR